ncbi:S1 RNA-binding domain-containing protein [Acrocarpospora catenulata]|uniref:S1 RNA-binding domain-containing protein n=1 Tax=Acrocarpospora catenulata TaxID=2836182 RepID=UPI001BDA0DA0|nr:S1 RNA-binding domain-containing protein [Acrocarpospora catenulata]
MPEPALSNSEKTFLHTLRRGQRIEVTVIEIADFGVTFVDIGGFTAMINIPELSWRRINHPGDVVSIGQQVTAEILDVDIERGRVALSLKALQDDPLHELERQIGSLVSGPVTKIAPIGVFVRVEDGDDGFEGLVPNTELGGNEVEMGDILIVRISLVDVPRRRIGLTLAQAPAGLSDVDDNHV